MEYHSQRFRDHSLLFYEDNRLIALLPAHIKENTLCSHFGLSYGGILHAASLTLASYLSILSALAQHAKQQKFEALILNEIPVIYQHCFSSHLPIVGHALHATPKVQLLSTVDFRNPVPLNTNRKRMIQKGKKNGYWIQEDATATAFWQEILVPRLQHRYHTTPVHTLEEMNQLMQVFPQSIKQVNVYDAQGTLVGGTTLFIQPHVIHLQYIAGNDVDNSKGALDLLIYTLLEQYKNKVRYFDFGSSHLSPVQLNQGLLYWKESFGARSVPQYCYSFLIENLLQVHQLING